MIEAVGVTHDTMEVATAGDFPLTGKGKAIRQVVQLIPVNHCEGNLLYGANGEQVRQQGLKVLTQLVRCDIVFLGEIGFNFLDRSCAVDAIPERRAGFVQHINAIGIGQAAPDWNEDAFSCNMALDEVGGF